MVGNAADLECFFFDSISPCSLAVTGSKQIMHATCQAESAASKATSRIKLEATTGGSSTSRETTPAIVETAATDGGGAGGSAKKKRKALDDAMADLDESQAVEAGDDRGLKRPKSEPTE